MVCTLSPVLPLLTSSVLLLLLLLIPSISLIDARGSCPSTMTSSVTITCDPPLGTKGEIMAATAPATYHCEIIWEVDGVDLTNATYSTSPNYFEISFSSGMNNQGSLVGFLDPEVYFGVNDPSNRPIPFSGEHLIKLPSTLLISATRWGIYYPDLNIIFQDEEAGWFCFLDTDNTQTNLPRVLMVENTTPAADTLPPQLLHMQLDNSSYNSKDTLVVTAYLRDLSPLIWCESISIQQMGVSGATPLTCYTNMDWIPTNAPYGQSNAPDPYGKGLATDGWFTCNCSLVDFSWGQPLPSGLWQLQRITITDEPFNQLRGDGYFLGTGRVNFTYSP